MAWAQVYRDKGLKWEKIISVRAPQGIDVIYSLRITQSRRATAYLDGQYMRLLSVAGDHDSTYGKNRQRLTKPCTKPALEVLPPELGLVCDRYMRLNTCWGRHKRSL